MLSFEQEEDPRKIKRGYLCNMNVDFDETKTMHTWTTGEPGRLCVKLRLQARIKMNIGLLPGFAKGQMASVGPGEPGRNGLCPFSCSSVSVTCCMFPVNLHYFMYLLS